MDSFDYGVTAITLVIALLGLGLVYLTLRSFVKIWESRGLNSGRKLLLIRAVTLLLAAGVIVTVHFWLFNPHDELDSVSYNPAGILGGLSLIIVGIILTYVILPFHRKKVNKTGWPWPRRHKITVLLCVVAAAGIGVAVYQQLALNRNRQDFQQAWAAIDAVYADIVRQIGQPDNSRRTNDCSRPNQEFEQGPLSCSVGTDFIYGVDNEQQANEMFRKIQNLIATDNNFIRTGNPASSLKDTSVGVSTFHQALDYYQLPSGLKCGASYAYNTSTGIDLNITNLSQFPFQIGISCYGPARAQYYPLEQ